MIIIIIRMVCGGYSYGGFSYIYIIRIFCHHHHHGKTVDTFNTIYLSHQIFDPLGHLFLPITKSVFFPSKGDINFINLNSSSRFVMILCESSEGLLTLTNGNFPYQRTWVRADEVTHLFYFSLLCVFKCLIKLLA